MKNTRIIPVLLLRNKGLYKTVKFKEEKYIGDPINAIKIFNEKDVDELILLDIEATTSKKGPDFEVIKNIASECFMPLGYGGGINNMSQIDQLFKIGVEKVIINSASYVNAGLIKEAAAKYGSQSIVASIDVKKNLWGKYELYSHAGTLKQKMDLTARLKELEQQGAGEIFINSLDKDGTMTGYD